MNSKRHSDRGFTLIEVLIAVTLLVFISFAMYRTVTQAFQLRAVLMGEGDFFNALRLSMGLLERDLATPLYPEMLNFPIPRATQIPGTADLGQFDQTPPVASRFWGALVVPNQPIAWRHTAFQGTEQSLSFVTDSHRRMYKDSAESTSLKVSYQFKEGNLTRFASTAAFDVDRDDEPKPKAYMLLNNIEGFRFRYFFKAKDQWLNQWDSTRSETRNLFPDLVELTLTVKSDNPQTSRLQYQGKYFFRVEVPTRGISASL